MKLVNRAGRTTTERARHRRCAETGSSVPSRANDDRPGGDRAPRAPDDTHAPDEVTAAADPASWVDEHGGYLFRFALHRVGCVETAEDLVQETFLAALRSARSFEGRSSFRTWLTGVLRHKIVDRMRQGQPAADGTIDAFERWSEGLFKDNGKWRRGPQAWRPLPGNDDERTELTKAIENCLGKLPPQTAEMFVLREQHDVPADRLADSLGITTAHLWVRLHRARLALRKCLESSWFQEDRR